MLCVVAALSKEVPATREYLKYFVLRERKFVSNRCAAAWVAGKGKRGRDFQCVVFLCGGRYLTFLQKRRIEKEEEEEKHNQPQTKTELLV